jgi:undecaprenyl-diphosphatase
MATLHDNSFIDRAMQWELRLCFRLNHALDQYLTQRFFAVISRLGNGVLWYVLMLVLPFVYGVAAIPVVLRMAAVAVLGLLLYKSIKSLTTRERPYRKHHAIKLGTHPLDQYSFPSGHTLHAVGFTTTAVAAYPELAWALVPFTALVAMSRVVLGLHYPTDVLAGAGIGAVLAWLGITFLA